MGYFQDTIEAMKKSMNIENVHAVPRITKVVLNVGVGKNRESKEFLAAVEKDLATISGQKPHVRRARKAVAGFNVREGNVVGYSVTLRGKRAEDFTQRFVNVTLPRVRDFRGVSRTSIDPFGNISVGVTEHLAFPEIHADQTDIIFGIQATFVTSAKTMEGGEQLFRALGFPLRGEDEEDDIQAQTAQEAAKQGQSAPKKHT